MIIDLGKKKGFDLDKLISSRMLLQANSGGGKSWALRRFLEKSHGQCQQIVLDLEGEFSTLREKYDYLIVGKEGDIPISIQTAKLLARKLMELQVSAIIDLYELKAHERKIFVKRFLDAMVNAPKALWHPLILVLDEGHVFAPEKSKSESLGSVIDIATRGRKRGICLVIATQRLSKLHKDVAAELLNKVIGRSSLDIDMKRAADELGFASKEQRMALRLLEPGEFFMFGPASTNPKEVIKIKIGDVATTHPQAGARIDVPTPPPTGKVKQILSKLVDLPGKAAEELKEIDDFKKEIRRLKVELTNFKKGKMVVPEKEMKRQMKHLETGYKKYFNMHTQLNVKYTKLHDDYMIMRREYESFKREWKKAEPHIEKLNKLFFVEPAELRPIPITKGPVADRFYKEPEKPNVNQMVTKPLPNSNNIVTKSQSYDDDMEIKLGKASKAIYKLVLDNPDKKFSVNQIAAILGYSPKSGHFSNSIYNLTKYNLIVKEGSYLVEKEVKFDLVEDIPSQKITLDFIKRKLGKAPLAIFEYLIENKESTKVDIAMYLDYSVNSGHFSNSIYRLTSLNLVVKNGSTIKLNPEIEELL